MPDCPTCGHGVPGGARFCPECGRPLPARPRALDDALVPRPSVGRRFLDPAVLLAFLLVVGAVFLALGGEWAWAAVAALGAAVVALARARLADGRGHWALAHVRARAAATREAMAARSREQLALFRARRELADLEAERMRLYRDLGYAVYVEDRSGIEGVKGALEAVADRISGKEAEIEALREETERRIGQAQVEVRPTERMETPPEPARVPEPWPPPDEGEIPDPIPSPGGPTPEEPPAPEHPPAPQTGEREAR